MGLVRENGAAEADIELGGATYVGTRIRGDIASIAAAAEILARAEMPIYQIRRYGGQNKKPVGYWIQQCANDTALVREPRHEPVQKVCQCRGGNQYIKSCCN